MQLSYFLALLASVAALTRGSPVAGVRNRLEARQTSNSSYAKADGTRFNIDGVTKYYAGSNSYWLAFQTNNSDIDKVLDDFVTSGLKIFRIWGFNDVSSADVGGVWFQALPMGGTPTINTGANGLQRLDYVVKAAEKRGVKLIINFVNNWNDYGGMKAYADWAGVSVGAGWYNSTKIQAQYQAYIKAVVSRYTNSTAIFAWELANEPRCNGCATNIVVDWATKTSKYIKSLDPNHMVAVGDEGFGLSGGDGSYPYGYSEGTDFRQYLSIDTIDFGTYHLYPSSWGVSNDWGNKWIQDHGAACADLKKPCLFEEFGISVGDKCTVEGGWQKTALATSGTGADLFWDWGDTISTGKTADDGNTVFYESAQWTCLVQDHVNAIGK